MSVKGKKITDKKLTAEELEEKIDELIEYCENTKRPPSDYLLKDITGVYPSTIWRWCQNKDGENEANESNNAYARAIKKLELYRNHYWLNAGLDNPKLQGFVAFNLKQSCNGGYTDRPAQASGTQIEVTIKQQGIGGDDAFK